MTKRLPLAILAASLLPSVAGCEKKTPTLCEQLEADLKAARDELEEAKAEPVGSGCTSNPQFPSIHEAECRRDRAKAHQRRLESAQTRLADATHSFSRCER
jgi:hypothetical protein